MKILSACTISILLILPGLVFGQEHFERIIDDYEAGRITYREYLVNRGYAAFMPERLPDIYRPHERWYIKCPTFIIAEIKMNFTILSPEEQNLFAQYIYRPSPQELPKTYSTPEGHFIIHYTTLWPPEGMPSNSVPREDLNNNGTPDFVEEAGFAFEHAYRFHVDTLGYNPMPSDGDEYDVYMRNLPTGTYGLTTWEYDIPETNWFDYTSYIIVSNDFQDEGLYTKGIDALRVTAAHELHHAIQLGYVLRRNDFWFYEWTSTWMEDMVWDNVNDYFQYLDPLFKNFDKKITTFNSRHEYGMCIFNHYLSSAYGANIIRKIWEQFHLNRAYDTMKSVIEMETGELFDDVIHEFFMWNYFTGDRADTVHYYRDGKHFPEVKYEIDLFQENDTTVTIEQINQSAKYIRITRQQPTAFTVDAAADPQDINKWHVGLLATDDAIRYTNPYMDNIPFLDGISGSGTVSAVGSNPELVVVITNTAAQMNTWGNGQYSLNLDFTFAGPAMINANKLLATRPSPADFSKVNNVIIPFVLVEESDIKINLYSISGRLIKSFPAEHHVPGLHTRLFWDGRDNNGNMVPNGIYIYIMKGANFTDIKKMAVIR